MQDELEANGIPTEFVEATDRAVYVGYQTSENDSSNVFTELQYVARVALEHAPGRAIKGAIFHTERPIIWLWHVESEWADQYGANALSEAALIGNLVHTLEDVSFA